MDAVLESHNIPKERMRGFTRKEIECWGCQAPFCGHRIMSLVDGTPMPVCSLREASREVLGMVRPEILDHNYTDDELEGHTVKELACNNCKGRTCGFKGVRIINGRRVRVCLNTEEGRRIFNADDDSYIAGQNYRVGV